MAHVFFNVITLPEEGNESEIFAAWRSVGEFMEKQPGFLGSTLYRNRQNPKMLINKGRYNSVKSFEESVKSDEFQRLSQRLASLGVKRIAGLYNELDSFGRGD